MIKKLLFIALLLCLNVTGQSITSNDFWQEDKIKHSIGSFGISTATYTFLSVHNKLKKLPDIKKRLIALSTTMLVGSIKEVIDSTSPNHNASWDDMSANAIGGLAFQAAITIPLNFNSKHKREQKTISSNSITSEQNLTEPQIK